MSGRRLDGEVKVSYGRHSKKHYHKRFLAQNGMLDKGISEAGQASPTLLEKGGRISCEMCPINLSASAMLKRLDYR